MVGGGNGQKERLTMKTSKLKLQNAPDCTDLHLDFKIFPGGHAPGPPYNWVDFPFLGLFTQSHPC